MQVSALLVCCWLTIGCSLAVSVKQATLDGHNDIRRKEAKDEHGSNLYELVSDVRHGSNPYELVSDVRHGSNLYELVSDVRHGSDE